MSDAPNPLVSTDPQMDLKLTAKQFGAVMSALNMQILFSIQAMQSLKQQAETAAAADAAAQAAAGDTVTGTAVSGTLVG